VSSIPPEAAWAHADETAEEPHAASGSAPDPGRRWGFGREALAAFGVLVVVAGLGWPLGLLWTAVAPRVPVRKEGGALYYGTSEPEQIMAGDGWFALLGVVIGIALAVLVWVLLRRGRGPLQMIALVLGCLAAASIAYYVGHKIGADAFERLRATTPDGVVFDGPLRLNITRQKAGHLWPARPDGVLALQAGAAALAYTCLAGWSRFASLRGPDPAPAWLPPAE